MYATAMPLTGCTAFGMTFKRRQNTAQKEMKAFDWFDRDKIECIFEGRSTSIFVENLETKMRAEITGWTMKY